MIADLFRQALAAFGALVVVFLGVFVSKAAHAAWPLFVKTWRFWLMVLVFLLSQAPSIYALYVIDGPEPATREDIHRAIFLVQLGSNLLMFVPLLAIDRILDWLVSPTADPRRKISSRTLEQSDDEAERAPNAGE